jgi:AcrR family transcriptional regulator
MGRPALQPDEISAFRDRLCDAALTLFATRGYDGFTLRALGDALDCSPATPYRYFESKTEIFIAVCERAFEALCEAQHEASLGVRDPWDGIRRQGLAYVGFTRAHPHAYRVMFDLRDVEETRALGRGNRPLEPIERSWRMLLGAFERAHDAGVLDGDPERLALSFWASIHGVMSLDLGGRLFTGTDTDALISDIFDRFERAYRPARVSAAPTAQGEPS